MHHKLNTLMNRVCVSVIALMLAQVSVAEEAQLTSEIIGGSSRVLGIWDMERVRETSTTPVSNVTVLNVVEQLSIKKYRIFVTTKGEQYMAEDQSVWRKGRCRGGTFSRKKRANPCTWESQSGGVLTIDGAAIVIAYDNPSYAPDMLTLNGNEMEGRDRNGPIVYVKRGE